MRFHQDREQLERILDAAHNAALQFLHSLAERPAGHTPEPLLPDTLPEEGLGAQEALACFRRKYEAQLSGSAGPRYLGFVTGGSTPAALAGDWLVSSYDQNVSNDGDSIATTVERETLALLRTLFALSDDFDGVFVSGATQANLVALATARQWAFQRLGHDPSEEGLWNMPRIPVFGCVPHASILKALSILGMGRKAVEYVPCLPGRQAIDPAALAQRLAAAGGKPAIVIASAGEVNTGDFDDLETLASLCQTYGAWLHVDGAFGLFAACDPSRSHLLRGLNAADSITTDGHKWLNVPYDSGLIFTRHVALQEQVFKAVAAYLGAGPDLLHRTPENSRRFRALPAWMTLMAYGRSGYQALVAQSCLFAQTLGQSIEQSTHFELLAPVSLNIVCFALRKTDADQRDRFLEALKRDGEAMLTPTLFAGKPAIRAAFVNWSTTERDVQRMIEALERGALQITFHTTNSRED
ncbi:aspartate aminotransferase family protein [Ktedonobacter sp. SOSP1-85]|uniref:pyridoxal phosphate-dependent decarboxylase family protein n=1 Tax=Ktedonobacter sp. SOSP1-85 TaxID=2778367 RepID=UPI0019152BDC|nr:pyridoxal-dependent decarboxylase [Ktedonobacter sp. SOSP1-85]GHO78813.1 aspartate aminotransferase family protein [Ktedonobacter sp. SOSP1-85]